MDINQLQRTWDDLGQQDPFWAILSAEDKVDNRWDPVEFFKTGLVEVDDALRYIESLNIVLSKQRALDFGCGVGRLTQALCRHFDECCGVDIAPSMINLARRYNQFGDRCKYHLNESDRLSAFQDDSWDFIYSNIVLQHMKPEYSTKYIRDFIRILRPGGIVLFQIPGQPVKFASPTGGAHLPDSAFRARITPDAPSIVAKPASRIHISAKVRNLSETPWPAADKVPGCPISLGNHWVSDKGELIALDDARARLNHDLLPNEEVELVLVATAPATPGNYVIELDMVQELVAWFGNKGSTIARVRAQVEGESPRASADPEGHQAPRIEMYGVPREQVIDLVAEAGGSVMDVRENSMAGLEWTSFSYCVTKP